MLGELMPASVTCKPIIAPIIVTVANYFKKTVVANYLLTIEN